MIPEQRLGLMKRAYSRGRRQLGYHYYIECHLAKRFANYWEFRLTEGRRLRRFKNIHAGERCFIIGNGPSIRQQDLTVLKDEIVFVANDFPLHPQYGEINPKYYCAGSPDFFPDSKVNPEWYKLMLEKTTYTTKFFPAHFKPIIGKLDLFKGHSVFYPRLVTTAKIWEIGQMSLDITKALYWGNTIIVDFCLPLAFYMGCSEIYLLGCDCDYGLDENDDYSKSYFFDVRLLTRQRGQVETVDFHKNEWYERIIASYSIAKEVFEHRGRRIYNAGIGGKLEVFERVDFESILATRP